MYTDESLTGKLSKLADTQDSINLLSHWLIFHRKNAAEAVQVWATEFGKGAVSTTRKLAFLHLANDVLQVSRKKADDYAKEFAKVLAASLKQFAAHAPAELNAKVRRLLTIWDERGVYNKDFVAGLKRLVSDDKQQKQKQQIHHPQPTNHHTDTVKTILHHTDTIKHLHSNRIHLERTISTAEPSIDPATIASQVNALTMALTSELNERSKLIADLKKWISVEEDACLKIATSLQDLTGANPIANIGKDFTSLAVPQPPQGTSASSFQAHAPPAAATKEKDFESHTPIMSPLSPPTNTDINAMDIMTMPAPPPPPPPQPVDPNAMIIPPELLFAAQSALQNNESSNNEVLSLLNGLTGSGGGLFGFGGDNDGF
ncbi:UNVERIFIED_CONTAM: Regulation of nuclear pre-mRNA domain containing protein 1B [Siphonaria sp. JEL0065]|nr:Regulation of nuclear pre-mRNA domain containing protein 1B [Siphonaria sp. JEL0065]